MFAVAIAALATPIADEAVALAADLGSSAYEERLKLNAGLPAVVLQTDDRERAITLLGHLRGRGHTAYACDLSAVRAADEMTAMRAFSFGPDAVLLSDDPTSQLPYKSILVLLRAVHRIETTTQSTTKEKKFSAARAMASGGLIRNKTVTTERTSTGDERHQLLYIFRSDGGVPWILWEQRAHYGGLGSELMPSRTQNFIKTIGLLRQRAPHAAYDERLMRPARLPPGGQRLQRNRAVDGRAHVSSSSAGVDLLAHLMALAFYEARAAGR
ncbi:MAG: hypothetical protein OEZ06_26295 [Myxococcales bacterium]|nr:hypothetical protein [Myxococcales bacterium]